MPRTIITASDWHKQPRAPRTTLITDQLEKEAVLGFDDGRAATVPSWIIRIVIIRICKA